MQFEHDGVAFDYDADDCDQFITAAHWMRTTLAGLEDAADARHVALYLFQLLPRLAPPKVLDELAALAPGWAFAETVGVVEDTGPVFGPQQADGVDEFLLPRRRLLDPG